MRSTAGTTSRALPLRWKVKQRKKLKDMPKYSKSDTRSWTVCNTQHLLTLSKFILTSRKSLHPHFPSIFVDYDRIIKNIERGEARISRKDEIMKALGKKLDRYRNPWLEMKIQYGQNKGKLYNEECDRFMVSVFLIIVSFFILWSLIVVQTDLHDSQTWVWELGWAKGSVQDIAFV